jgi:hypothetical protein
MHGAILRAMLPFVNILVNFFVFVAITENVECHTPAALSLINIHLVANS